MVALINHLLTYLLTYLLIIRDDSDNLMYYVACRIIV